MTDDDVLRGGRGRRRARWTVTAAVLTGLVLGGCGGSGGDEAPDGAAASGPAAPSASPGAAASAAPDGGAPSAAGTPAAGGAAVTQDGLAVVVPAGWRSTALTPQARQQAVAGERDPRVAEFLRGRLDGLAGNGAVLYLYDLRGVADGVLATVEVYRYPSGRTPDQVVEQVVVPRLTSAGLRPVRGQAELPAGAALTVTARTQAGGQEVSNEQYVLALGPTTVGLSATTVGPPSEGVAAVVQSLRAA